METMTGTSTPTQDPEMNVHYLEMNVYFGFKKVRAKKMNRLEYNTLRGWKVPDDENPLDEGYLVEYLDGGQRNHPDYGGYISWSPKDVFNEAYKPSGEMTFGMALEALKSGDKVARTGWNGKGMYIYLKNGTFITPEMCHDPKLRQAVIDNGGELLGLPTLCMFTHDGTGRKAILTGWLASQSDMLSSDWIIIE